jgi:hypothetical protein
MITEETGIIMGDSAWIALGGVFLAFVSMLVGAVRYFDNQIFALKDLINDNKDLLGDKISIGEYTRRHEDLERRVRIVERWQDHRNGMYYGQDYTSRKEDEKD